MMRGFNHVSLRGQVIEEPENIPSKSGFPITRALISVLESKKDWQGEVTETETVVPVYFYGGTAEAFLRAVQPDDWVLVDARLRLNGADYDEEPQIRVVGLSFSNISHAGSGEYQPSRVRRYADAGPRAYRN